MHIEEHRKENGKMGFGMLNGILSGLVGLLTEWISKILGFIMKILINILVVPVLKMLITLIEYVLGAYFYSVSVFLLNLLDFVQLLFRAFAGLPTDGITLKFTQGGGGLGLTDPLMQIITAPAVREAFISMAIVGFFLLIITTIFQMIKVEYTTEGAKNSKTPILQKAFKGACNLVLLPLLVIFGIFIGNKVLDLLDTATNPGENTRMSDLLFVTSASDAFYKKSQFKIIIANTDPLTVTVSVLQNSVYLIIDTLTDTIRDIFGGNDSSISGGGDNEYCLNAAQQKDVEEKFMNHSTMSIQEVKNLVFGEGSDPHIFKSFEDDFPQLANMEHQCRYDNAVAVTSYYNYAKINYLLLMFSACLILKALFFSVFGLITRLYKCAILFIISPAVVGMTPINEGGLGKWRTAFIGQVLSAYGTVLSVNLFLTLVKLMISIEITFNQGGLEVWGISADSGLSSAMMTGIIKTIMIISGAYLIEKFSKDLGGYFGADDAMAAGKEAAKDVSAGATKALAVGAAVAGGGAMLMGGALKAGKGIASGLNKKTFNIGGGKAAGQKAFDDTLAKGGTIDDAKAAKKTAAQEARSKGRREAWGDSLGAKVGRTARSGALKISDTFSKGGRDMRKSAKLKAITDAGGKLTDEQKKWMGDLAGDDKRLAAVHKAQDHQKSYQATEKDFAPVKEKAGKLKLGAQNRGLATWAGLRGATQSTLQGLNPFKSFGKQWKEFEKTGAEGSDEAKTAIDSVAYNKGKKHGDRFEGSLFASGIISSKNDEAARIFAETAAKQFAAESARLSNSAAKQAHRYRALNDEFNSITGTDPAAQAQKNAIASEMRGIERWMAENDVTLKDNVKTMDINGDFHEAVSVDFKTDGIMDALKAAVKNGASKEELAEIIKQQMKDIGKQGNDDLIQQIIKEFEKTMQKFQK